MEGDKYLCLCSEILLGVDSQSQSFSNFQFLCITSWWCRSIRWPWRAHVFYSFLWIEHAFNLFINLKKITTIRSLRLSLNYLIILKMVSNKVLTSFWRNKSCINDRSMPRTTNWQSEHMIRKRSEHSIYFQVHEKECNKY